MKKILAIVLSALVPLFCECRAFAQAPQTTLVLTVPAAPSPNPAHKHQWVRAGVQESATVPFVPLGDYGGGVPFQPPMWECLVVDEVQVKVPGDKRVWSDIPAASTSEYAISIVETASNYTATPSQE